MKKRNNMLLLTMVAFLFTLAFPADGSAAEKVKEKKGIPEHVLNISKENTFPNATENLEVIEPSELTKELMEGMSIPLENPELIKMLNETTIKPSPIGIGYRGMVYLGRWPLNYASDETNINWEYQQVNVNELNNIGGDTPQNLNFIQQEQKEVKGALTNKIAKPDEVKNMMLLKAKEKTKLPLSYATIIGKNTKKNNIYVIPPKKLGNLQAFSPAVNEKGQVTFGEVYIQLKGTKKSIEVKNVTKQGIGAWIPIQDHLSFSFRLK